jgi:hypothetical protein
MRIALDIDSTLHHYWDLYARTARGRFGVVLPYEDQVTWTVDRLRPEQARAVVEETHRDVNILAAIPYAGAVDTAVAWHEAGHFIHITSHRADTCHEATAQWLEQIGMPYDELYLSFDKISRCREIAIDVLIDDSPVNLRRALDANLIAATLLHPWNRELCEEEDVVCGEDWAELAANLDPLLTRVAAHG